MVTFSNKAGELFKSEVVMLDNIVKHLRCSSAEEPVPAKEISMVFNVDLSRVKKIINHIRTTGKIKGLLASQGGYYVETDPKRIEAYRHRLLHRARTLEFVANCI
jgi:hypothetical protein